MTLHSKRSTERRGFFGVLSRAIDAYHEFDRLNKMSDETLAAMNLSRDQIPQYVASRL